MQNKQKVTLYIPPELHRQLKIKAAVDVESMSNLVEKAISFYLQHPEEIEKVTACSQGKTHQIHFCPECDTSMVMRNGEMVSLKNRVEEVSEGISLDVRSKADASDSSQGEEDLVPCI